MNGHFKIFHILLFSTMAIAFCFGFLDQFIFKNFERLHIFLFNLTSGGFTILYLTECKDKPSLKNYTFFILSLVYAVSAFFEVFPIAIVISLILACIVEKIRQENFSIFPREFFSSKKLTSRKFHHASLICLEAALVLSSLVIINNVYLKFIVIEKLKLNLFFLGFSFPVSLITFSLIFRIIEKKKAETGRFLSHLFFWSIPTGVGIFFFLILFQVHNGEIALAFFLFAAVLYIFVLFFKHGVRVQQKHFLVSGMYFLLISAVTGTLYIVVTKFFSYDISGKVVMKVHSFFSLYGWNLSGMLVILRWNDFPIRLSTGRAIYAHWLIIILSPLSKYYSPLVFLTVPCYTLFLLFFFFSRNRTTDSMKL